MQTKPFAASQEKSEAGREESLGVYPHWHGTPESSQLPALELCGDVAIEVCLHLVSCCQRRAYRTPLICQKSIVQECLANATRAVNK